MKILQVINTLLPAGAQILVRDLCMGLVRRGIQCDTYVLQSDETPLEQTLSELGISVHGIGRKSIYSPRHILSLRSHLSRISYDLVHVHLFPSQLWTAIAAWTAGTSVPLVTTEHNTHNRRRRPIFRLLDQWMYSQYVRIACISSATAEALVQWLPELAGKIQLCPNGIRVGEFAGSRVSKSEVCSIPETATMILTVGRLEDQKDHETVLRALPDAAGMHLALVGEGQKLADLRRLARDLRVADRVHFLGQRQDVSRLMKAADIFVQSSRWEGFGIAALEAMASGLPVVASRVPGLAEVVGEGGLMFESGDHHQLAARLIQISSDANLKSTLSGAGKSRAAMFDIERTLDCYEGLYRELGDIAGRKKN
jgi:glycosyltransferase involved in cell wall biosynthesis